MTFDPKTLELKWQKKWEKARCFDVEMDPKKPKFYALSMFPYPSGSGLHIGHLASYTPTEIVARYKRSKGFNVLHPMGWDAFGLPAEQYAIHTGIHPSIITEQCIDNFRRQLKSFGYSFNWEREICTCKPDYYKWTQWIFTVFFKKNLAYQKKIPVNWCPALKTILANEEVIDGKSERGNHPVIKKPIKQWLLAITKYADKLLKDLKQIDWPERTKEGQKNWIGKSLGARIHFPIKGQENMLEIFTTRPDTLFGVTFMVISPEHPLTKIITSKENEKSVQEYVKKTLQKSDVDRKASENKTGVFTGAYALHPFTKEEIPIWTADYVLMDYGTGAIMAVPAHDERDFAFAQKFQLPIKQIMTPLKEFQNQTSIKSAWTEKEEKNSIYIHSHFLNGLTKKPAIKKIIQKLEETKTGQQETQYKLKDWIFSRQRYWGEPFPIVHFMNQVQIVEHDNLPVCLPKTNHYAPSEKGESPLARQKEFINYIHPKTKKKGQRDKNTMPGSAASSWYFLRYTDPHNKEKAFDFEKQKYWMPVDLYVGGAEHTVGHLLYSRFWQKFLYDQGLVSHKEPFKKLVHQGMILGEDFQKMSKSRGNTTNPDTLKEKYGADTIRVYITFLGPLEKDKPWSPQGIEGSRRFLNRVWRLCFNEKDGSVIPERGEMSFKLKNLLNRTVKKVTEDIENLNFNTAISAMMILVNELYRTKVIHHSCLKTLAQLLMPFAPHIAEEIWSALGGKGFVSLAPWPSYQDIEKEEKKHDIGVQINGKTKSSISCYSHTSEQEAVKLAIEKKAIQNALKDKTIKKIIYKACRILNIIIEK